MSRILLFLIRAYQSVFSPDKGIFRKRMPTCVFYPTCSDYAVEAIQKHGSFRGGWLTLKRIIRCHPWQKEHIDLVP